MVKIAEWKTWKSIPLEPKILSIFADQIVFYFYKGICEKKIVSEVVLILDTIIFNGLSTIDLCFNKSYIKQTFSFGFR